MTKRKNPIRQLLNPGRVLTPVFIGLAIVLFFLIDDFKDIQHALSKVTWTWKSSVWLVIAILMAALRDLGYMIRIRFLTDKLLSWRQSFDIIMLWEFGSAITPSVVGGSGIAVFILNREKIPLGRSTAVVLITAFLDELFYVLMVPLLLIVVGWDSLFPVEMQKVIWGITLGAREIFVIGYIFILILISLIWLAIFRYPEGAKRIGVKVFSTRLLKRWRKGAIETGNDLITTSHELRGKPKEFWFKAFVATFLSWTARFWVVNFLILSLTVVPIGFSEHMLIYARQLVMWVILLISPTPGGSGVAELAFGGFLESFISPIGMVVTISILWRMFTYYPYLILGSIILPRWIQRVYLGRKLISFRKPIDSY